MDLLGSSILTHDPGALALWLFDSSRRELPDGYEANAPWAIPDLSQWIVRGGTLQYSDLDAENWENGRTYYVSVFSYFFQFWKRPC